MPCDEDAGIAARQGPLGLSRQCPSALPAEEAVKFSIPAPDGGFCEATCECLSYNAEQKIESNWWFSAARHSASVPIS
jgi:hypothetical protein